MKTNRLVSRLQFRIGRFRVLSPFLTMALALVGGVPGRAAGEIYVRLHDYERRVGGGYAFPDNVGFIVNLPNRRSFSPDAAFYKCELRGGLFLEGAPVFAVEVRSAEDYGPAAERRLAAKRADYFAAGALCEEGVRDVLD
jgi:Uma2 family endonuclease